MSVINQVLLDLEKRRASAAERGVLPDHIRALPETEPAPRWRLIAGGGLAAVTMLAGSWVLYSGMALTRQPAAAPLVPQPGTEIAIERVVAVTAGVTTETRSRAEDAGAAPPEKTTPRLTLELSNSPVEPAPQRPAAAPAQAVVPPPLPTSRVVGRDEKDLVPRGDTPPAAPVERPGPPGIPAAIAMAKPSAPVAEAKPSAAVVAAKPAAAVAPAKTEIQKQERQPTPREHADNEYRKATAALHQGRHANALEGFEAALNLHPAHHGARQALVGLLLDGKKYDEAERVLQEGVKLAPAQAGFIMTLARLQVDRGDTALATATLQKGLEHAHGNADYLAFLGALLQRQGRHEEAIEQFQAALRARPASGVWWLGLGISLQAVNRTADAQDAYRRARATNSLNPDLAAFAEQRVRQLQ